MIVPLTIVDFLERAEHVYGNREAMVDEPGAPGGDLGRFTDGRFGAAARSLAAALDEMEIGENERVVAAFEESCAGRVLPGKARVFER